jgi:hypothetical protein
MLSYQLLTDKDECVRDRETRFEPSFEERQRIVEILSSEAAGSSGISVVISGPAAQIRSSYEYMNYLQVVQVIFRRAREAK